MELEYLQTLFPKFQIIKEKDEDYFIIGKSKNIYNNISFYSDIDEEDKKYLCLHTINSNVGMSGKEILNKIENYASHFNFEYITLEDSSYVVFKDFEFSLPHLNIMSKGLSYYNECGYFQDTFIEDISSWNNLKDKLVLNEIKDYFEFKGMFIINRKQKIYNIIDLEKGIRFLKTSDTFLDIGKYIYNIIRNDEDEDLDIIRDLFIIICNFIDYGNGSMCTTLNKRINL
jgi:hypothetical protein